MLLRFIQILILDLTNEFFPFIKIPIPVKRACNLPTAYDTILPVSMHPLD